MSESMKIPPMTPPMAAPDPFAGAGAPNGLGAGVSLPLYVLRVMGMGGAAAAGDFTVKDSSAGLASPSTEAIDGETARNSRTRMSW